MINGPEAFTPDNEFCLGETEVGGFFVAAGFCAHGIAGAGGIGQVMAAWILDGDPGWTCGTWTCAGSAAEYRSPGYTLARVVENYESYYDIRYPGRRAVRGPAAADLAGLPVARRARRGVRREGRLGAGELLRPRRRRAAAQPRATCGRAAGPGTAGRRGSSPSTGRSREAAALFDESSFAKIEISGPDAAAFCRARLRRPRRRAASGAVTYTQALNDRGGIEHGRDRDPRGAPTRSWWSPARRRGAHDLAWLRDRAPGERAPVRIADVTGAWACFGLWGPRARDAARPADARGPVATRRSRS